MQTNQFNHAPAQIFMNTGHQVIGRPSLGSWLSYGLGSENADLPAFVVLLSGENNPDGGKSCWGSGFLPTMHQGVEFRSSGEPVLFVSNPEGVDAETRGRSIAAINDLNRMHAVDVGDPEIQTRIAAYELAYRMQTSVPELTDVSKRAGVDPRALRHRAGQAPRSPTTACWRAAWSSAASASSSSITAAGTPTAPRSARTSSRSCRTCAGRPIARSTACSPISKQRGLLDDTLVVWGGEFGRTPMNEARNGSKFLGRDHHPRAFTMWLAGGGIKPGITIGRTDELGYNVVEDPVDVHDLHATMLRLLGIDHEKLTYKFQGRDFRLTDVHGKVVDEAAGVAL